MTKPKEPKAPIPVRFTTEEILTALLERGLKGHETKAYPVEDSWGSREERKPTLKGDTIRLTTENAQALVKAGLLRFVKDGSQHWHLTDKGIRQAAQLVTVERLDIEALLAEELKTVKSSPSISEAENELLTEVSVAPALVLYSPNNVPTSANVDNIAVSDLIEDNICYMLPEPQFIGIKCIRSDESKFGYKLLGLHNCRKIAISPRKNQFEWETVEECVKRFGPRKSPFGPLPDNLPDPLPGFEWHWVDDIAAMCGIGGWLEVDVENKRQGRFDFSAMG
jgi:hypothetical protein